MNAIMSFLSQHGAMLAIGASALLFIGALAALAMRSPIHRQRIAETSVAAAIVWVALACVPMQRWSADVGEVAVNAETRLASPAAKSGITIDDIPKELIVGSTAPAPAPPPVARSIDFRVIIVRLYLTGVIVSILWLGVGVVALRRIVKSARPLPRTDIPARILISPRAARPFSFGVFRPTIVLPTSLDDDQTLRQILLHESSHVTQRDARGAALFNLALPLLWFCPFYWLLRRIAFMARELVADDYAARADGKETYASCLVALAKRGLAPVIGSPVIGLFHRKSDLYRRIQMLLKRDRNLSYRCSKLSRCMIALAWIIAVAGSAAFVGVRPAIAQEKDKEKVDYTIREKELIEQQRRLEAEIAELRAVQDKVATERAAAQNLNAAAKAEAKVREYYEIQARLDERRRQELKAGEDGGGTAQKPPIKLNSGDAAAVVTGVQLDLVNLANSVVDASGAKAIAEVRLKRLAPLAKENTVSREEIETAETNYVTAKKRVDLLRGIAQVALESAKREADYTKQLVDKGFASRGTFDQQIDKMKMLELIIRSAE